MTSGSTVPMSIARSNKALKAYRDALTVKSAYAADLWHDAETDFKRRSKWPESAEVTRLRVGVTKPLNSANNAASSGGVFDPRTGAVWCPAKQSSQFGEELGRAFGNETRMSGPIRVSGGYLLRERAYYYGYLDRGLQHGLSFMLSARDRLRRYGDYLAWTNIQGVDQVRPLLGVLDCIRGLCLDLQQVLWPLLTNSKWEVREWTLAALQSALDAYGATVRLFLQSLGLQSENPCDDVSAVISALDNLDQCIFDEPPTSVGQACVGLSPPEYRHTDSLVELWLATDFMSRKLKELGTPVDVLALTTGGSELGALLSLRLKAAGVRCRLRLLDLSLYRHPRPYGDVHTILVMTDNQSPFTLPIEALAEKGPARLVVVDDNAITGATLDRLASYLPRPVDHIVLARVPTHRLLAEGAFRHMLNPAALQDRVTGCLSLLRSGFVRGQQPVDLGERAARRMLSPRQTLEK